MLGNSGTGQAGLGCREGGWGMGGWHQMTKTKA